MPPDTRECPYCQVPLESPPLARDLSVRVCPQCGMDRLALLMEWIAGNTMVWDYRDVSLYVRWSQLPVPSAELVAAKRLIPALRRVPHGQLASVLGKDATWHVGDMPTNDGRALFARARQLGLTPELVYQPEVRGTSLDPNAHGDGDGDGEDAPDGETGP